MNTEQTDVELLSMAADGNGDAFAHLFRRHRDRVFRHVLRLVETPSDAEDLVGLAFAETWRKRDRVRVVDSSVLPWLLVTATNLARNNARAHRRYRALLARLPTPRPVDDHSTQVLDQMHRDGIANQVRQSFDRLSERDREILSLCVLEELSTREVADILRVPPGTIKSRLSRARNRLTELVSCEISLEEIRSMQ